MIERAYERAVENLRVDPHFPLLVPTLLEVAAYYRRMKPEARLAEVREEIARARLQLADQG
jgi:hypothetical protein